MIVADTSVWIAFFNGAGSAQAAQLQDALQNGRVLLADLILAEVLQGFRSDIDYRRARKLFDPLPCTDIGGRRNVIASSENYRLLRASGVTPRGTIDVLIATFCIENGHTLLHADKDFDAMVKPLGLEVL